MQLALGRAWHLSCTSCRGKRWWPPARVGPMLHRILARDANTLLGQGQAHQGSPGLPQGPSNTEEMLCHPPPPDQAVFLPGSQWAWQKYWDSCWIHAFFRRVYRLQEDRGTNYVTSEFTASNDSSPPKKAFFAKSGTYVPLKKTMVVVWWSFSLSQASPDTPSIQLQRRHFCSFWSSNFSENSLVRAISGHVGDKRRHSGNVVFSHPAKYRPAEQMESVMVWKKWKQRHSTEVPCGHSLHTKMGVLRLF
nr:uncharacterized protein LOC105704763 [Aotus nancymaae]